MKCGRLQVWVVMLGASMVMSACVVDTPSLESLTCSGNAMTPEAECIDGKWVVRAEVSMPTDMADFGPMLDMDMAGDMLVPLDMPDMPDLLDMPDLEDPCSDANITRLCEAITCGTTAELLAACPLEVCPDLCDASQECVGNTCITCLELGDATMLEMAEDGDLCKSAAEEAFTTPGDTDAIACGGGAMPAALICGLERELDCQGVCPEVLECGSAGVCCLPAAQIQARCDALPVFEVCDLEPAAQHVRDCETGQLVSLSSLCTEGCPLQDSDLILGSPVMGIEGLIEEHAEFPSQSEPLKINTLEFWLRPTDAYFTPAMGVWAGVTGRSATDRINATLFNGDSIALDSANDMTLHRSDAGSIPSDVNFNHYVDLKGGFVEFDRPSEFKGDVSAFIVFRNKSGDEVDTQNNDAWYQRPAVLSGEHGGSRDFGVTLNEGKVEWGPDSSDTPAVTSPNSYNMGEWHVLSLTRKNNEDANNAAIYVDGQSQETGKLLSGDFDNPLVRMGRQTSPWEMEGEWHGDVAEVMLFSDDLSDQERRRVQTYLAIKYGVSLRDNYRALDDSVLYSVFGAHDNRIFGVMCDAANYAVTQHTSRSSDGLWSLRAGSAYSNLGRCPTASFSVIMGDDDGALSVANDSVIYTALDASTHSLDVLTRTWLMRISAPSDPPNFTMVLDIMQSEFVMGGFEPEMLLLEDQDGEQLIVPLTRLEGRYDVAVLAALEESALDVVGPLTVRLARFTR